VLEAVIFDFDGVIADTPTYYFRHMKSLLKRRNADISDEHISALVGHNFSEKLEFINKNYGLGITLEDFIEETSVPARKEMSEKIGLDPFLKKLLLELKEKNVPLAIATTNVRKNVSFILEKFGISEGFFSHIVTAEHVRKSKPFPDIYIKAIELLGAEKSRCVAVEDTLIGVQSAKAAGLKAVALPNSFTEKQDFSSADRVIKSFRELDFKGLEALVE